MKLIFWMMVAVGFSLFCSILEVTLLSVRPSALLERSTAGSTGAARLLEIKQTRIDDAISANLILNTVSITVGATLGGASAAELFGEAWVGVFSAVLTVLLLVLSEIIPKTIAARHAGKLSGFTGLALTHLIRLMTPMLILTRVLINLLARQQRERMSRRELELMVVSAPQDEALTRSEAMLIGSLIYSRQVVLKEVMTPLEVTFMLDVRSTISDLISANGVDAFSRIPLFDSDRRNVKGYISHREVLKAFACAGEESSPLSTHLIPIPAFRETERVDRALQKILEQHESIALVTNEANETIGLVTLEDIFEAILGIEITDESEFITALRPKVAHSRKRRSENLRSQRAKRQNDSPPR